MLEKDRDYLRQCRMPVSGARIFYQLITVNGCYQSLFLKGSSILEITARDTLEHFLTGCARLSRCRALAGIAGWSLNSIQSERMAEMLTIQNEEKMSSVWSFLVDGLEIRRFMERKAD